MSLSTKKGLVTRYKNVLANEILDVDLYMTRTESSETPPILDLLTEKIIKLEKYAEKYQQAHEDYILALEKDPTERQKKEEIDKIVEDFLDFFTTITEIIAKLFGTKGKIEFQAHTHSITPLSPAPVKIENNNTHSSVKLPKLEIPTFDGNILKFSEFWDTFLATVHTNQKLANIEKFTYLRSKLSKNVLEVIAGLSLTNENYSAAIELLLERFGNKNKIIKEHYAQLMEIPVSSGNVKKFRTTYDQILNHLRSLEALGQSIEDPIFIHIIQAKLPKDILTQMELLKTHQQWTVKNICEMLKRILDAKESAEPEIFNSDNATKHKVTLPTTTPFNQRFFNRTTGEALTINSTGFNNQQKCIFCGQNHWADECPTYPTVQSRKEKIKGHCYICLKKGHTISECRLDKPCYHCKQRHNHHRSLCRSKFSGISRAQVTTNISNISPGAIPEPTIFTNNISSITPNEVLMAANEKVLMQTAKATISNLDSNIKQNLRIFFDTGSQRTFITEYLANKLNLDQSKNEELAIVTFGSDKARSVTTKVTNLIIELRDGSSLILTANIVPKISGDVQRGSVNKSILDNLDLNIHLADTFPLESEYSEINLLIGNDYYLDLINCEKIMIQTGLYLLNSKLGWILTGRHIEDNSTNLTKQNLINIMLNQLHEKSMEFVPPDNSLNSIQNSDLANFWKLETIGITDSITITDDEKAAQLFSDSIKFEDGRYEVGWPWKEREPELNENFSLAYGRLKALIYRLKKHPELYDKYNGVIIEQEQKGTIEKVLKEPAFLTLKHYIPHHAVITPSKAHTKVRIVYDASAKTNKSNKSLNECLYRGPVMLEDLCGLLLRFRTHNICIIADIEKAFLQVSLKELDRDVTRFLWLKDPKNQQTENNLQIYRFCRLPFGIISSPFLLTATINYHLDSTDSPVAKKIKNDIYVDNLITGVSSVEEGTDLYSQVKQIFNKASMNLRDWVTNSEALQSQIPKEDRANSTENISVLGINWNLKNDTITIPNIKYKINKDCTKRTILQVVASVYDPLGYFAPVILAAKLLLQQLWKKKIDWDDPLDSSLIKEWMEISSEISKIPDHSIPRLTTDSITNTNNQYKLVCFCDASGQAYATTVYLVSQTGKGSLIYVKTRLSPQKELSIPRLELTAVLIGVRSLKFVAKHLKLTIIDQTLYTDAQCVLSWINSTKPLSVFVANRIKEINKSKEVVKFQYVPTNKNPADLATRKTTYDQLVNSEIWWKGPKWISDPAKDWETVTSEETVIREVEEEVRKNKTHEVTFLTNKTISTDKHKSPFGIIEENYSSLKKLINVTAYAQRFIDKLRRNHSNGSLQVCELSKAKNLWIKYIQKKHYNDSIIAIKNNKKNGICGQLGLFLDDCDILHCQGRYKHAEVSEEAKYPKLLPSKCYFTKLVIRHYHEELLHSGMAQTLARVRCEYWIPRGRAEVNRVTKNCVMCRKIEGHPFKMPNMPPWPKERVSQDSPFRHTGLDYLGPLYIKTKPENKKVWVCLFTCLSVRAVHLELVQDMSTEQFLLCLRRFIARRGVPSSIISDNATQFKSADKTLQHLWKEVITNPHTQSYASNKGIQWKFIVTKAPWMGGFYERLVGLVKRSLRKTLGKLCLNEIQLQTLLTEIEAVINTRPMMYLDDDINSWSAITPAHFLSLNPNIGIVFNVKDDKDPDYVPASDCSPDYQKLLKSWKKGHKHLESFWKMWREGYLLSLRERYQTGLKHPRGESQLTPKLGDVVLIKEKLPRGTWRLGKIHKLNISKDGQVRSAEVMLASKFIIKRALSELYPIECPKTE